MSEITIAQSTYPPIRGGRAPVKESQFHGIPLGVTSGPPIVFTFAPDPWIIKGTNGANLSAFSNMALTLGLYPEPSGNTITYCGFGAVETAFGYQSLNALLEITLYAGGQVYYATQAPINSGPSLYPNPQPTFDGETLPAVLCNSIASYFFWISFPGSGSDVGPVVFNSDAYSSINGCSLNISGTWSPC